MPNTGPVGFPVFCTVARSASPNRASSFPGRARRSADHATAGITNSERGDVSQEDLRVNERIRISPVRLIGEDGEQVGIVATDEAREIAAEAGLDLVEVAPNSRPPVCRIMDYGKYKYEQARKARESKKKQHQVKVKEIKLRPKIEEHDINFKAGHARRFLGEGNKVKLTMRFRGREMTHTELGEEVLEHFVGMVSDVGQVEERPKLEGRNMTMVLAPKRS